MRKYKVFNCLPVSAIVRVLSDVRIPSMRAAMRRLGLNTASSSASTKLKKCAQLSGVDISRFKAGRHDHTLVGKRFGILTVLRLVGRKLGQKQWYCRCQCGRSIVATTAALNAGCRHHCGCGTVYPVGPKHQNWTGYEEIPGHLWAQIRWGARVRELDFDLSIESVWELFIAQRRKCALSGVDIAFGPRGMCTASLDRKTAKCGYTASNVQWVHKAVNRMKGALDDAQFRSWCSLVSLNNL